MQAALDAIIEGRHRRVEVQEERGWKLFFFIPQLLLFRPARGGIVPRDKLEDRLRRFAAGDWLSLLAESSKLAEVAKEASVRKRRRGSPSDEAKAVRAEQLASLGELSAARRALEGAVLAPGTLTNPVRRPPRPRDFVPLEILEMEPDEDVQLDDNLFAKNIRITRRGAAPGPSGMTSEHLFPLLESDRTLGSLCKVAGFFAKAQVPQTILSASRLGRMTALRKPSGGMRGIVVGDVFRRLVARTLAQQFAKRVESATAPFQYALCVSHALQSLTDLDGVGAFDLVSRKATLEGLLNMEGGDSLLPFARQFYGSPSTFLWEDEMGTVNHVQQGEGGEHCDPLMPLLFALGQHSALVAVSERLHVGELLFAFHDDLYIKSSPDRAVECSHILRQEFWQHCRISLNNGKTRLWNRAGSFPRDCEILEDAARWVDPDAVVWKGDPDLPLSQQGIKILGVPVGRKEFIEHELDSRATCHAELLEKIPNVKDLQCAWLILLCCGVSRANFFIRAVSPDCSLQFATRHEAQIWRCLTTLVGVLPEAVPESAKAAATLPLSSGGLGCRSSVRLRHAAHWASWADSIKMIGERHPEVVATILREVDGNNGSRSIQAINSCTQHLEEAGFVAPDWVQLASGARCFPRIVRAGWTRSLSAFCCSAGCASHSLSLRVRACVAVSSTTWATIARLAQLLGSLDEGVFLWRLLPPICREAGGRVRTNVFLRELDLGVGGVLDRRLEVVVNGLPLFNGAQLAVDTTLVSPIRRDGTPRPRAHEVNGIALKHARRHKETTYPELAGRGGRARLVVIAGESEVVSPPKRLSSSATWLGPKHVVSPTCCVGEPDPHGHADGAPCWVAQLLVRLPPRCWTGALQWVSMVPSRVWPRWLRFGIGLEIGSSFSLHPVSH